MEEGGEVTRLEYEELLYEEGKEILKLKAEINDKDEKAKVLQIAFDRLFEENNHLRKKLCRAWDKCDHMVGWLQGIVDYEVDEVCKDGFAYDRLMNNLKNAARKGLGLSELEEEENENAIRI